ncbi:MAG: hypothetical protein V4726_05020 [Verrucomicrobiota bacterium]
MNHLLTGERDAAAARLADALKQLRWKDFQIAKLSHPTVARQMGEKSPASAAAPDSPGGPEENAEEETAVEDSAESSPYALPADNIYGPFRPAPIPMAGGRVTLAELRRLKDLPPVEVEDYILKARLLDAGGREVSAIAVSGGQRGTIQFLKEFPYPTKFDPPQVLTPDLAAGGSFPVTPDYRSPFPVTPGIPSQFEFKNTGWTVDLEMSARGGLLLIKGHGQQVGFEGFTAQPGETARPVYDDSGTLLSDNKQLQPNFTTREAPFLFDMLPGKTYRLPLSSGDGGTVLELSPVPVP